MKLSLTGQSQISLCQMFGFEVLQMSPDQKQKKFIV